MNSTIFIFEVEDEVIEILYCGSQFTSAFCIGVDPPKPS